MTEEQTTTIEELNCFLTSLFVKSGRQEFRRAFIEHYPNFMYRLRNAVPEITAGEEILCMLIYLNQNSSDIAAILSICGKSVKQTRYRLRLKIGLSPQIPLETFVHQLVSNNYAANKLKSQLTL